MVELDRLNTALEGDNLDAVRHARFAAVVTDIQKRWGSDALVTLGKKSAQAAMVLPTGMASLDALLAGGGLPVGQITELIGAFSSGVTTVAFCMLAHAQSTGPGERAAYIDLAHSFDADYAARCQVDLKRLLVVRPSSLDEAFDICGDLVARYGAKMLLIDPSLVTLSEMQRAIAGAAFRRLVTLVRSSVCTVLCLTRPQPGSTRTSLQFHAALSLLLEHTRWIQDRGCVRGCETRVTVLKQKAGPPARRAVLRVAFDRTL